MAIHKAQGGTFDSAVYCYNKSHPLPLLYVALSRVQSLQGLYIVTSNEDLRFYHCRRADVTVVSLQQEFKRLSLNKLTTIDSVITQFMTEKKGLSLLSLNCQSLRYHVDDLDTSITRNCNLLLLTETWLNNKERIDLPNFDCIAQYKRENVRSAGDAIYKNTSITNVVTSHMQVTLRHVVEIDGGQSDVGDICAAQCTLEDGRDIVMIVVYISPKQNIQNIIKFLQGRLIIYSKLVSQELESDLHEMPIILSGDFNINFASEQAQSLIQFLNDKFELKMNNDPLKCTTKSGTTIDAVFSRYLHKLQSTMYITYFSYHKPIISFLELQNNVTITEITDDNE